MREQQRNIIRSFVVAVFASNRDHLRPAFRLLANLLLMAATVALVVCVQPSYAQVSGYATIKGTVTGSDGGYAAPYLPAGHYSVTASHSGFKSTTQPGVTLTASQIATVNLTLSVGQVQEIVEVTAAQEMIETRSAALGQVANATAIQELPLNTRNPAELTFLVPGGVNGAGRGAPIVTSGNGSGMPTETGASIDASRMGGVYYMLDGIYNMDNYLASANPFPNPDATQEFRV